VPSGGVEPGEESSEAAIREVEEEVSNRQELFCFTHNLVQLNKRVPSFRYCLCFNFLFTFVFLPFLGWSSGQTRTFSRRISERCKSDPNLCLCVNCYRNARDMGRRLVNAMEILIKVLHGQQILRTFLYKNLSASTVVYNFSWLICNW